MTDETPQVSTTDIIAKMVGHPKGGTFNSALADANQEGEGPDLGHLADVADTDQDTHDEGGEGYEDVNVDDLPEDINDVDPATIPDETLRKKVESMQADYTRKTMAVAEQRRKLEELIQRAESGEAGGVAATPAGNFLGENPYGEDYLESSFWGEGDAGVQTQKAVYAAARHVILNDLMPALRPWGEEIMAGRSHRQGQEFSTVKQQFSNADQFHEDAVQLMQRAGGALNYEQALMAAGGKELIPADSDRAKRTAQPRGRVQSRTRSAPTTPAASGSRATGRGGQKRSFQDEVAEEMKRLGLK